MVLLLCAPHSPLWQNTPVAAAVCAQPPLLQTHLVQQVRHVAARQRLMLMPAPLLLLPPLLLLLLLLLVLLVLLVLLLHRMLLLLQLRDCFTCGRLQLCCQLVTKSCSSTSTAQETVLQDKVSIAVVAMHPADRQAGRQE